MNKKVMNFLLAGDKSCLNRIQKLKKTGGSIYNCQKELDRACFQHHMTYRDFKDLHRRKASDRLLRDKAFNVAKNLKCDEYQRGLASLVYIFFIKSLLVLILQVVMLHVLDQRP